MTRSKAAAGFGGRTPVSSSRLLDTVAASLMLASLSLCLMAALTLLSSPAAMALAFPT